MINHNFKHIRNYRATNEEEKKIKDNYLSSITTYAKTNNISVLQAKKAISYSRWKVKHLLKMSARVLI